MNKFRWISSVLWIVLVMGIPTLLIAQPVQLATEELTPVAPTLVEELLSLQFDQVTPSVFQRMDESGKVETVAFGSEGLAYVLGQLEAQLEYLLELEAVAPLAERQDFIAAKQLQIEGLQSRLDELREAEAAAPEGQTNASGLEALVAPLLQCTTTVSRDAKAYPTLTGPGADASSSFWDDCSNYGQVHAYSYAEGVDASGIRTGTFQQCDHDGLGSASCAVAASVAGVSQCWSNSDSSVTVYDPNGQIYVTAFANNDVCQTLRVSLTGTSYLYVPAYSCATAYWYASASGGTPGYTYQWRYNGVSVPGVTSYSRTFCNSKGLATSFTVNVSVTVTDSRSATASASKSALISYGGGGCIDPCACPIPVATSGSTTDAAIICPAETTAQ